MFRWLASVTPFFLKWAVMQAVFCIALDLSAANYTVIPCLV